jgi:hypothetical protein
MAAIRQILWKKQLAKLSSFVNETWGLLFVLQKAVLNTGKVTYSLNEKGENQAWKNDT